MGDVVGLVDDMGGKYTTILSLVHINLYSSYIKCLNCGICLFICRFYKVLFTAVLSSGLLDAAAETFLRSPANKIGVPFLIRQVQRLSAHWGGVSDVVPMANPPRGESKKYEFCEIYI